MVVDYETQHATTAAYPLNNIFAYNNSIQCFYSVLDDVSLKEKICTEILKKKEKKAIVTEIEVIFFCHLAKVHSRGCSIRSLYIQNREYISFVTTASSKIIEFAEKSEVYNCIQIVYLFDQEVKLFE